MTPPYRCLAKVIQQIIGFSRDDSTISIRCNGREFHIDLDVPYLNNSPSALARYRRYLAACREEGEFAYNEETGEPIGPEPELEIDNFHEWLIDLCQPVFQQLAPDVPPVYDPDKIAAGDAHPVLTDYLLPATYGCRLEAAEGVEGADADTAVVRYLGDGEGLLVQPLHYLEDDLLDDLERYHVRRYAPADIAVAFENPEDATRRMPARVYVDNGGTPNACLFKQFGGGDTSGLVRELRCHLPVLASDLAADVHAVRLLGIVWVEGGDRYICGGTEGSRAGPVWDSVGGLLLTYVGESWQAMLTTRAWEATMAMRRQWGEQVRAAVDALHRAGVVWGDAKIDNVMVDGNDNAWLIDFGGGYTEGWVDRDKEGTPAGDLQGVEKIIAHLEDKSKYRWDSPDA